MFYVINVNEIYNCTAETGILYRVKIISHLTIFLGIEISAPTRCGSERLFLIIKIIESTGSKNIPTTAGNNIFATK